MPTNKCRSTQLEMTKLRIRFLGSDKVCLPIGSQQDSRRRTSFYVKDVFLCHATRGPQSLRGHREIFDSATGHRVRLRREKRSDDLVTSMLFVLQSVPAERHYLKGHGE